MAVHATAPDDDTLAGYRAIEELYHAYLTGLVLTVASRSGPDAAEHWLFDLFRSQQLERFLPGLVKLGLTDDPPAVACAKYHYLSNHVGGVKVQFIPESDTKAWVRYLPPRWIFDRTAICGVPTGAARAMLRAWHANNGVLLGDLRIGFVCTGQVVDGQGALEGYYRQADHDLAPDERLVFRPGERGPTFDPDAVPVLDADSWPEDRRLKACRNYAMEYVRNGLPALVARLGPADGGHLGRVAGKLIGMQLHDEVAARLGAVGAEPGAAGVAGMIGVLARAQGDDVDVAADGDSASVTQRTWRLLRGIPPQPPEVFEAWNGLWEGLVAAHDPALTLTVRARLDLGDDAFVWQIAPRRPPSPF